MTRSWRLRNSLGASIFQPTDDTTRVGLRTTFEESLAITKAFNYHAFTRGQALRQRHRPRGVSAAVRAGSVTCVLGDNGAGKSTLIKILSGSSRALRARQAMDRGRDRRVADDNECSPPMIPTITGERALSGIADEPAGAFMPD